MAREIVRVEITKASKIALDKVADRHGMVNVSMYSRLMEWLSRQDTPMQMAILRAHAAGKASDVTEVLLKMMAGKAKGKTKNTGLVSI